MAIDALRVQVDLDTAKSPRAIIESFAANGQVPTAEIGVLDVVCQQNEMLRINSIYLKVTRATVAAPVGFVRLGIRVLSQGKARRTMFEVELLTNAVGDERVQALPVNFTLFPNDELQGYYSDTSTGGTVDAIASVAGVASDLRQGV